MLKQFSKRKKAIMLGICFGIAGFTAASLGTSKNTDAAVLVHDDENIAQAIQTVTNTYNILTNLQKQLMIDIANIQKLASGDWLQILKGQAESEAQKNVGDFCKTPEILAQSGELPGILNKHTTPTTVMTSTIGRVQDIVSGTGIGTTALHDPVAGSFQRAGAIEASARDTAQMAGNVTHSDAELARSVDDALQAANNAEGILQVEQANVAIAAAQVRSIQNGNMLLAQMAAANAQVQAADNMEKAIQTKLGQIAQNRLKSWVASF